jgi:pimeloyl-ACP methyl ester carboxylesterase
VSATTTENGEIPKVTTAEAGRIADVLARSWGFTPPRAELLDPTPPTGPDPYGDPDPAWMRIDWREHLKTADVGGTRINYAEMGPTEEETGPPIVFVHGLGGRWANWLENIPHFARHHRVLAPDLPGFGHSPLPSWNISIESMGRVLLDFCNERGAERGVVVGNSMGGFIAAEAVIQSAQAFERMVLVSAAGISHAELLSGPAITGARMMTVITPAVLRMRDQALRRPRLRFRTFGGVFHNPLKLRAELLWEFATGAGTEGFLPAVRGLVGYDFLDSLEEVELPVLIVWGRNDRIVPPADAAGYGSRLRGSSTVIYDRTGHCPMAERPVRFNRELEAFIAG